MSPGGVVFVGGNASFGSVQIRCVQIARALSVPYRVNLTSDEAVPHTARVVVLVKPAGPCFNLNRLLARGVMVVWDVVDAAPPAPRAGLTFLASTRGGLASQDGFVIPHHHANDGGFVNNLDDTLPTWIGSAVWYPQRLLAKVDHRCVFTDGLALEAVRAAYRRAGILLLCREPRPDLGQHLAFTSGIKLINAIGFGLPSITFAEPAYFEVGADCTIFTDASRWRDDLVRLQEDVGLRDRLRQACRARAAQYSLNTIAAQYRAMFQHLTE